MTRSSGDDEFVTEYTLSTTGWSARQLEYKFGAIMVIPPEPHLTVANRLRSQFRWAQGAEIDAHISLTVRLSRELTGHDWSELETIAERIRPFTIYYGPLKHYLPFPGVCWEIQPQDKLDSLRAAVETASCFRDALPRPHPFSAHMTIAELLTVEQTEQFMNDLKDVAPHGSFQCNYVSLVIPDSEYRFTERRRLHFAR